jgi:hypothetical protein
MNIELLASDLETPECEFAITLKSEFEFWLKNRKDKDDKIFIAPNMRVYGENIRDIDVFVFGILDKGVSLKLDFLDENKRYNRNVYVSSFCFAIDIRNENIDNIVKVDNDIWINANGRNANFSVYNRKLFMSIRKFIQYCTNNENNIPFISTCLFFKNLPTKSISSEFPNFLRGELTIQRLFQSYAYTSSPNKIASENGEYYILNGIYTKDENAFNMLKSLIGAFSLIKSKIGPLTKIKLDAFSKSRKDLPQYYDSLGNELLILKGGAGTGKTLKILNIAKELYDSGNRCLILTYNRALVSDINRLLDLNSINAQPLSKTIKIKTIHSFLSPILDEIIHWKSKFINDEKHEIKEIKSLASDDEISDSELKAINSKSNVFYLTCYTDILKTASEKINDFNIKEVDKEYSACFQAVSNFDFILIDEAQDWQKEERDILYNLFGSNKIIIADGLQQLIRTQSPLNWKVSNNRTIQHREMVLSKKSLRQNEKLCHLQNYFAKKYSVPWDVLINEKLSKGTVYVFVGNMNEQIAGFIKDFTKGYSTDKYDDLLFLSPPQMIDKTTTKTKFKKDDKTYSVDEIQKRSFKHTEEFHKIGLDLFDMTHVDVVKNNQPKEGEYRLINYESCRGLESYGVVALEMDTFFDNKIKFYKEDKETIKQGDIFAQTHEDKALRYAAMWSLIVFSRPVELLVITIKDKNSIFYRALREIKENNDSLLEIIE